MSGYNAHQQHLWRKQANPSCEFCRTERRHPVKKIGTVVMAGQLPVFAGWEFDRTIGIQWTARELYDFAKADQAIRAAPEIGEAARNAP